MQGSINLRRLDGLVSDAGYEHLVPGINLMLRAEASHTVKRSSLQPESIHANWGRGP